MDKYKKLAANTLLFAVATFSSKLLSIILTPIITHILPEGNYGDADLVKNTANILIPIVFVQIASGVLRFALDNESDKRDVFSVGLQTMATGYVIFLLFWYPISLIQFNGFRLGDYIILIYVFVLTSGLRHTCQHFVRGSGYVKIFAVDGVIATALTLLFNVLFLAVFKWGVYGYVLAIIAADLCSVCFFFVTCKLWRFVKLKGINKDTRRSMLRFSIPLIPTQILWWVINMSDRYMIRGFVNAELNGVYTLSSQIPNFVAMFATIFMDAWQLSAVDEYDNEETAKFFSDIFRVFSGGVFAIASILIVFAQPFTVILGRRAGYFDAWHYSIILIMATTISCFVNFLGSIYMAEKKSIMSMVTALAGAATNVVLNFLLIPKIGAYGAAIATVTAFAVVFISRALNTRKYVKVDFKPHFLVSEFLILVVQCCVMLKLEKGVLMYAIEGALFVLMLVLNIKPIKELINLILGKFLHRGKSSPEA